MKRSQSIAMAVGIGMAVVVSIFLFSMHEGQHSGAEQKACGSGSPAYWYDPMRPTEHFQKPGKSPFMDMQLVPKCQESRATAVAGAVPASAGVEVDSRLVEDLGLRVAPVEQGSLARGFDTVGLVGVDEHGIQAIQVREPGWVEELHVRAVGEPVHRGELLAGIYSPELLAAQQELLIARGSHDAALIDAARTRLTLFGLAESQVDRIVRTGQPERRVNYYAPLDGYVMDLGVRQGAAVQPGATLFQLADLATVWITAEVPEVQGGWIKKGEPAEVTVPALPGERFSAQVDYLYPELMEATRTLKVRLVVKNARRLLQPGMFASIGFAGETVQGALTVPTEAVIKTGARSVVIVADDPSHFRPVAVRVGVEHGGRSQILEGLALSQRVVASGQFLIDSEASLRGAFDNLVGASDAPNSNAPTDSMSSPGTQSPQGAH